MAAINFFTQDIPFKIPHPVKTRKWIREVIVREKHRLVQLNYIFCSDDYLLAINQQYLRHKTLTDIITFDHREAAGDIEGDIFISVERVKANALELGVDFDVELHRVIIHGVLHLAGHKDKSREQKLRMRKKEEAYLSLR